MGEVQQESPHGEESRLLFAALKRNVFCSKGGESPSINQLLERIGRDLLGEIGAESETD